MDKTNAFTLVQAHSCWHKKSSHSVTSTEILLQLSSQWRKCSHNGTTNVLLLKYISSHTGMTTVGLLTK